MSSGLHSEEEVTEYLNNMGIEYRFQCYSEKNPDGCHRLADFLEAVKKDSEKAARVYRVNCQDHGHGHSCFKYGSYLMMGKGGVEKDTEKALESYQRGCDGHFMSACHSAGQFLGSMKRYTEAANLYRRACDNDLAESCYYLGSYYIVGKEGVDQDFESAFKYSKKACDMKHIPSCINLSMMYKNGHGVEKDLEKAKEYTNRAKTLHEEQADPGTNVSFGDTK